MATLGNPKNTIEIIQKYQFAFQKKFGQNFLIDTRVLDKIISAAGITEDDCVLEIGPGIGTMTQYLAEHAGKVVAVEIDTNLLPILDETLKGYSNVTVINSDILKLDMNKLVDEYNDGRPVKVAANLPYYITTPIIMGLFESNVPIDNITVMVQKEAGTRLCAPMGTRDMGAVTVAINYFSVPKLLFNVSRGSFMPSPNVDSCVVRFDIRDKTPEGVTDEKFFFKVARGAFSQRRKTLSNSVSSSMGIDKSIVNQAIEQSDLPASVRPEALSMEQFITFSEALRKLV